MLLVKASIRGFQFVYNIYANDISYTKNCIFSRFRVPNQFDENSKKSSIFETLKNTSRTTTCETANFSYFNLVKKLRIIIQFEKTKKSQKCVTFSSPKSFLIQCGQKVLSVQFPCQKSQCGVLEDLFKRLSMHWAVSYDQCFRR